MYQVSTDSKRVVFRYKVILKNLKPIDVFYEDINDIFNIRYF